jgi:hypothetical protein
VVGEDTGPREERIFVNGECTNHGSNIWQRDPLAIRIFNKEMAAQKLDYMHLNPMQPHWLLCSNPADYRFSSARFYEQQTDEFRILTHFGEVF